MEGPVLGALFVGAGGVPYRLFIHNCLEKDKIASLIECGFGIVESCSVGEYTLTLAAPGFPAGKNEIFSIEYITACCSRRKKLDIKKFRLNESSEYNEDFNPMDVLEGIMTWSEAEKYRIRPLVVSQSSFLASDNCDNNNDGAGALTEASSQLWRQRRYSLAHEKDILEFVMRGGAYHMVKGNALWKVMEEKKMCGGRTWQSMKEHFLKKILPAIESFDLTEAQITSFKNARLGSSDTNSVRQSLYTEHPDGQEDQGVIRKMKYYREAEDRNLLNFIVRHERYKAASGVRLWKLMERKKVVPGRTWQSMRERFHKVLIQKLEYYLPSDVATQMLEADLGGTKQRTKKSKAFALPHSLSPQTNVQMTEPGARVRQTYPAYPTTDCISPSRSTSTSKSPVDSKACVVTDTQNKKDSKQNLINRSKRKLFSQKKSLVEFTPSSESEKSTQSSEYQSAAVAQVHHSTQNSKNDDGGCSKHMRYVAVACVNKKLQHNKNVTTHCTGKSDGAVYNTEHTCQENVARKSDGLFRKLGISKESSVLKKGGNLLEFRGASEASALDNASNECNLYVASGERTDSEINVHPCCSNSAQEVPEEEVGRNYVRNVPTEEQAVFSKERKRKVVSYQREQQAAFINDNILENMPHKETAVQSKSSRRMLKGHRVTEKLSCGRSQDEVMSEKTSYEQNIRDLSDKESLMEVDNFTQKMTNCMKTRNAVENTDSSCISQNSCHEGTNVCSCSHDDSLNEGDTGLVGTEHNNVKLKHIIPNNQNTTGKSPENASDEREETHAEYEENSTNLICIQPLRDTNDCGEVRGIENIHDTVNIDSDRKNGSDISLHDMYKTYKLNGGQLCYHEYIVKTLNACAESLGHPEMIVLGTSGEESDSGYTADHSGHTNEFSGSAHVSFSSSSGPSRTTVNCSDIEQENITANPSPKHPTHCCSSQASMSPSSSLSPEESSRRVRKGFVAHQAATARKSADVIDVGQPFSSAHGDIGSCDWLESSTENSD